ncbi:MAG: DUF2281 domain-containing protein [Gemmatimonadetes bacterium]|nr:DUF2281 domain-containing protein [Gemmatimonadota bacterium]
MRKIESLPEDQVYQVLDYIEFLESRYGTTDPEKEASGLQRLAEGIEDRLRNRSVNPSNLREAFQVWAAADRALSGVAKAGRQLLEEIAGASDAAGDSEEPDAGPPAASADEPDPPGSAPGRE